ncbi:CPBP family intramembrane glutamic endopeptidase [Pseudobacter ginsenosidimutans]|uniref:CAAX prenyl protease-like protein n=1 Tax=Pseudobacter ginsenosidimutans TaxID=661488 RepID=A0A4V2F286_9BACT|nr:type II CAAX endopeptidase family protein [Pseudobacter ginsenosidimutans]QEC44916.1 CPBP family intramembrane metalloprotease [Pseudobacter ginsenosidimutans]RZS76407.1 CAAX prenyl protease-like protein [Pseudobacter ginsenosidimutans]
MIKVREVINKFPIISFIVLTFLVSHIANPIVVELIHIVFPGFTFSFPEAQLNERSLIAQYGPTIAALFLIIRLNGFRGLQSIIHFNRVTSATAGWLFVALALPLVMIVLSYLAAGVSFPALLTTLNDHWQVYVMIIAGFLISAGLAEEFGWRGFLLPRLLKTNSPLMATFIVFVVVSLWHFPALLAGWKTEPILPWTILSLAITIVHSWFFFRSGGNLVVVILFHASFDAQYSFYSRFIPGMNIANTPFHQGWAYILFYCLLALVIIVLTKGNLGSDCLAWNKRQKPPSHSTNHEFE